MRFDSPPPLVQNARVSNIFYAPGEQRAAKVHDLFAAIARRYDLLNDLQSFGLHRLWKRRVVLLARVKAGDRALDICCGTGDIAFALARQGAETTGLDFSDKMLEVAKARTLKLKTGSRSKKANFEFRVPNFRQGDAQQIPFPDNSFDVVTVGYGLRNLSSWEKGLEEMNRVARPGARLAVLDFGKPPNPLWRKIYFTHLKISVPLTGWFFCGNAQAYAYILESLKNYPAQSGVAKKMREMKLANVRIINLLGGAMAINCGEKLD